MHSAAHRCTGQPTTALRKASGASTAGFSLLEMLIAIMMVTLVYAIAIPSLSSTRVRAAVHNSKNVILSSISMARSAAIRFGRSACPTSSREW